MSAETSSTGPGRPPPEPGIYSVEFKTEPGIRYLIRATMHTWDYSASEYRMRAEVLSSEGMLDLDLSAGTFTARTKTRPWEPAHKPGEWLSIRWEELRYVERLEMTERAVRFLRTVRGLDQRD